MFYGSIKLGLGVYKRRGFRMKETVSKSDFCDAFVRMNRKESFSYEGREALFDYLTEMEQGGDEIELDVIAICCDYAEYESIEQFRKDYSDEYVTLDDIRDKTTVIELENGGFIIQQF